MLRQRVVRHDKGNPARPPACLHASPPPPPLFDRERVTHLQLKFQVQIDAEEQGPQRLELRRLRTPGQFATGLQNHVTMSMGLF